MAPRKQAAKKVAAESVVVTAVADGNVTPPKKRKTAAKSAAAEPTDEPKKARGKSRQAKADKQESEEVPKLRSRQKNTADNAIPIVINDMRTRRRAHKEPEDTVVADEKVTAKRTRGGQAAAVTKKAGIKVTSMKPKAKAPAARKQRGKPTVESGAEDSEKKSGKSPAKRTARAKAVEESDVPAQPAAKRSRRRKPANEAVVETIEEEEEGENEAKAATKNLRSKPKKKETDDAPVVTSKKRSKKNPAKEIASLQPKEVKVKKLNSKEQNAAIQEDDSKTKNVKNTKKENAKRALKRKLFIQNSKDSDIEETPKATEPEEAVTLETDVKENGEVLSVKENGETLFRRYKKYRNAGKANVALNGKVEAKGKQKKGQAAAVESDEKEAIKDVSAENKTTKTKVALEIDENGIKDVSSSGNDSFEIDAGNNDSTILVDDNAVDTIKVEEKPDTSDANTSNNEVEKSGTFLCY